MYTDSTVYSRVVLEIGARYVGSGATYNPRVIYDTTAVKHVPILLQTGTLASGK